MAARFHIPELRTLRARLAVLGALVRASLAEDANVNIDALEFEIGEGARLLSIGRGPLSATREAAQRSMRPSRHAAQYEWDARSRSDATIPLDAARRGPFVCGRAYLARTSGVRGGGGGLGRCRSDHGKRARAGGHAAAGDAMTFDGNSPFMRSPSIVPRVASEIVRGVDATLIARGVLDDHGALRLDDGEISAGGSSPDRSRCRPTRRRPLRRVARASSSRRRDVRLSSLSMPTALDSDPRRRRVDRDARCEGTLVFDSRKLDDLLLDWKVDDGCTLSVVPEALAKESFLAPFEHTVYLPDGTPRRRRPDRRATIGLSSTTSAPSCRLPC